ARSDLIGRRIEPGRAAGKNVVEDFGHLARVAVADPVNAHARVRIVPIVETLDPCRGGFDELRPARENENRVHAADRLKLDDTLTEAALSGIGDFFEFRNDWIGGAVPHRENSDRLSLHPVHVET